MAIHYNNNRKLIQIVIKTSHIRIRKNTKIHSKIIMTGRKANKIKLGEVFTRKKLI